MYAFKIKAPLAALVLMAASATAFAQDVKIDNAWARASVAGQKATGAFMTLTSKGGTRLVGVASPSAGVAEVHEMAMQGEVMKMRAVSELELPAGKAVELKPGGYHVMLMDLKQELKVGDAVPVTLVIEGAGGKRESVELKAPVKALADGQKKH